MCISTENPILLFFDFPNENRLRGALLKPGSGTLVLNKQFHFKASRAHCVRSFAEYANAYLTG